MTDAERAEWLKGRKTSIGASDVGGLLGLADPRWSTPLSVWESKISDEVDPTVSGPAAMGLDLEPYILAALADRLKTEVYDASAEPIRHPTVPLAVNPDAMVKDPETGEWCPCEVKFATGDQLSSWTLDPALGWNMLRSWLAGGADFPAQTVIGGYYCQIQAQILCTGAPYGWLVGVIGARAGYMLRLGYPVPSQAWRQMRIEPDPEMHRTIETACARFWADYVETRQPPPTAGKADLRALKRAYWQHTSGKKIERPDGEPFAQALEASRQAIKAQETAKDEAEAWLRRMLGDAQTATCGEYRVSAKTTKTGSRPVRVAKIKAKT